MTNSAQPSDAGSKPEAPRSQMLGEAGDVVADMDNIYLTLDSILDTRLGTLAQLDPQYAINALNSGRYRVRMIDEFDGVTKEAFKEAYAKRNIDTIKHSVVSNLVFFLRRLVKDSLLEAVMQQRVERMCFTVNIWPYQFEEGLVEMLIGCIRFHTYSTSSVRIVSIPDEELTPRFCRENFQIMIMYDWVNWCAKHKAVFEKEGMPTVTVVSPELFTDRVPNQDEIDALQLRQQNPFKMTEQICAPMFRLKYMPVSLFCLHEGITKDNAKAIADRVALTDTDIKEYLNQHHPKAELIQEHPLPEVDLSKALDDKEDYGELL